jgi:Outer membrane protein beta-barrel domain
MMRKFFLLSIIGCFASGAYAQDFSFGIKAGMNLSTFKGDAETDDAGNTAENYDNAPGFHVGATFSWEATELMGLRGEFVFSQEGGDRTFNGPSYYILGPASDTPIYATGSRKVEHNVTNSYLNLPVMGYIRPLPWLEIQAGAKVGFLISSTGFGDITFEGTASNGSPISLQHELDVRYFSDKPGQATFSDPPSTVQVGGEKIPYPQTAGAYFEFAEDRGNLYKFMELSALAGISVYLNKGLYVSLRANYGITDLTKTKADVSQVKLDEDKQFISRNDKDTNVTLQASVGFSF